MSYAWAGTQDKVVQLTANLAQAAGTYTLGTATGSDILLLNYSVYVHVAGATFTAVQITTNQTNAVDIMSAAEGVVANLTAQKNVVIARTQPILLKSGQLLQYIITGATGTGTLHCTFTYRSLTPNGTLV